MGAMMVIDGEEYLTGDEAAGLLGVKRETLYASVRGGRLKSYRPGIKRPRLYRRADIEALLRLAPSIAVDPAAAPEGRGAQPTDVPLAESWIRE